MGLFESYFSPPAPKFAGISVSQNIPKDDDEPIQSSVFHSYFSPQKPVFIELAVHKNRMNDDDKPTHSSVIRQDNKELAYKTAFQECGGIATAADLADVLGVTRKAAKNYLWANKGKLFIVDHKRVNEYYWRWIGW